MNIGEKLKKLRENNNMTRKEAANKLKLLGIDISDKTLYGYESGRSSANADMFLALCEIYNCKNIMETFSDTVEDVLFTDRDWKHIQKYHDLDEYGRKHIDYELDRETQRVQTIIQKDATITNLRQQLDTQLLTLEDKHPYYISYYQRMASAGTGEYLFDDLPTDLIGVPDTPMAHEADFVIGVNGHSMEPTYFDGEKVFVQKADEIPTGSIGVFVKGNNCYIKELGTDRLISHNEDKQKYPDILADEEIRLVGKVLGKVNRIIT